VEQRTTTTVAPQALLLLNNTAVRNCAEAFARRIAGDKKPLPDIVRAGYLVALGRAPREAELGESVGFVSEQTKAYQADGRQDAEILALADFCQVLTDLNEFVYID
jgi:hypothetical protein